MCVCERVCVQEHRAGGDVEAANPVLQRALAAAHRLTASPGSWQEIPRSVSTDARSLSSQVELCPINRQRGFFSLQIMLGFVRGARWRLWSEGLGLIHPYPRVSVAKSYINVQTPVEAAGLGQQGEVSTALSLCLCG